MTDTSLISTIPNKQHYGIIKEVKHYSSSQGNDHYRTSLEYMPYEDVDMLKETIAYYNSTGVKFQVVTAMPGKIQIDVNIDFKGD